MEVERKMERDGIVMKGGKRQKAKEREMEEGKKGREKGGMKIKL